ncbi:MAG TPA: YARHG domain-containing protein [Cytophagaceae bacterium]|jgi:hypothetical protein|nr:YARHG domain-containing protein [Cytophagaceae bacterium]
MKKNILLLISIVIASCTSSNENVNTNIQKDTTASTTNPVEKKDSLKKDARNIGPEKSPEQTKIEEALKNTQNNTDNSLLGSWVGQFGQNKINIFIATAKDNSISGHSVCAGNFREIKGELQDKGNGIYSAVMKEPGDNKYDGQFQFTINQKDQTLQGEWTPFNTKATGSKKYSLSKKIVAYNPELGKYPQGSTKLLKDTDISNMLPEDLKYMRNEIYARHGYSFQNKEVRSMFDKLDWYVPVCVDVRDQLTDNEVANIDLIYQYEKYYEGSYDNYGR